MTNADLMHDLVDILHIGNKYAYSIAVYKYSDYWKNRPELNEYLERFEEFLNATEQFKNGLWW